MSGPSTVAAGSKTHHMSKKPALKTRLSSVAKQGNTILYGKSQLKRKSLTVQDEFGKIVSIERTELCFVNV